VSHVSFLDDGARVLTGGADGTSRVWDAETGGSLAILPAGPGPVGRAQFSPDGSRIVSVSESGRLSLWDADDAAPHRVIAGHGDAVSSLRYGGRDDSLLITASTDGTARVWDGEGREQLAIVRHDDDLQDADLDPSGEYFVIVDERGRAFSWRLDESAAPILLDDQHSYSALVTPDGTRVAVGGLRPGVWELESGERQVALAADGAWIVMLDFAAGGTRLLGGDAEGSLWTFDPRTGERLDRFRAHEGAIWAVRGGPSGALAATAGRDGTARVWNLETGERVGLYAGHLGWVRDVEFSPDGELLATAGVDGTVRVWGVGSERELARLVGHTREVSRLAFSPDGSRLASSSYDGTARLWRLPLRAMSEEDLRRHLRCLPLLLRDGNPSPADDLPGDC
jgi:WD40 repeat protein